MELDLSTVNAIKDLLTSKGQTLTVAESVTSGMLQASFAAVEKAMDFFQGGITAYNLGQKVRHLNVEPIHAFNCDCVSEKVAAEMAIAAGNLFSANWSIAVTGYASPLPEKKIVHLFAYYAISLNGAISTQGRLNAPDNKQPLEVIQWYTNQLLSIVKEQIQQQ
jgi:nicotinamide-nucleotide amidase